MKTYKNYIENYFKEPRKYSREKLANEMNISVTKLDSLLQLLYEKSFTQMKLERVHLFSLSKNYSEPELAELLGFSRLRNYKRFLRLGLRVRDGEYKILEGLLNE